MMQRWLSQVMEWVSIQVIRAPLMMCIIVMCSSCYHTRYVPVESVKIDSIILSSFVRDSIYIRDSILVKDRGDTVYVDRWHIVESNKNRIDTLYRYRDREIQVPYPVDRELTWWQKTWIKGGQILLPFCFILLVLIAWLVKKKGGDL